MEEAKARWYWKRKSTTILGIIIKCFSTFEYMGISISALYYYQNSFHVSNPSLYYGWCMGAIFLSGAASALWCGRYMDKTRNLRKLFLVLMGFGTLGNILYTFTFSKWCPILGRFITGLNSGALTALAGIPI